MIYICFEDRKYNIIVNEFYNKIVKINKNVIIINNLLCLTENTRESDIYFCFGLNNWYQDYNKIIFPKHLIVVQLEYYIKMEFSINYINILKKSYKVIDFYKENTKLYEIFNFNLSNIIHLDIQYNIINQKNTANIVKPIDILYYGKINDYINSIQQLLCNHFEDKHIVFIDEDINLNVNENIKLNNNDIELYNNDIELYNNDIELYNNDIELYNNDIELYDILSQSKILLLINSENVDKYLDIYKLMLYISKTKNSYIISSQIRDINDIKKFENVDFVFNNNIDTIIRKIKKYFENFKNDPISYIQCNELIDKDYYDLMYNKITSEKVCDINFKLDILLKNQSFNENNIEKFEKYFICDNNFKCAEDLFVSILTIINLDITNYKKRINLLLEKFNQIYENYNILKLEWIIICDINQIKYKQEINLFINEEIMKKLVIHYKTIFSNKMNSLLQKQIGIQNCKYNYISLFYYIEDDIEKNDDCYQLINRVNCMINNKNLVCVNSVVNENDMLKENYMLFDKERFLLKELIKHIYNDFYSNILSNKQNVGIC
jgi:hypothetical protein